MGSFNLACPVSGLSILCGDDVYTLFLIDRKVEMNNTLRKYKESCGESMLDDDDSNMAMKGCKVSNEGAYAEFKAFGFVIESVYDDYGQVCFDVTDTPHVKLLETFFDLPIDKILECALDGDHIKSYPEHPQLDVLEALTVTFIHKDVYDALASSVKFEHSYYRDDFNKRLNQLETLITPVTLTDADMKELEDCKDVNGEIPKFIIDMELNAKRSKCRSPFAYGFDMYELLSFEGITKESVREQYTFGYNISSLYRPLDVNQYGSQDYNYDVHELLSNSSTKLRAILHERHHYDEDED
jgi:hypothetical protein